MLGLDNPIHLAFLLVLLLLVFGAKRLPEMGKSLGAGLRGFKESISSDEPAQQIATEYSSPPVDEAPAQTPVAAHTPVPVQTPADAGTDRPHLAA